MVDSLWTSLARTIFETTESRYVDPQVLAKQFDASLTDVVATLDALDYLEEYLVSRGLRNEWPHWIGLEFAFRQVAICRRQFSSAGDKLLFSRLAFLLLDDATPRPISRQIERLSDVYSHVRRHLSALAAESPDNNRDDLVLLGHEQVDEVPFVISEAIQERGMAREFARKTLQAMCA